MRMSTLSAQLRTGIYGAKTFIAKAGLTPYNVARKRGELKFLLLTESTYNGELMLRFVLRSETKLAQLATALPWLQQQLPQLAVISANIQPVHMAILEGEREIPLTEQQALPERFNQVPLYIRPQSFSRPIHRWRLRCMRQHGSGCRSMRFTVCGICSVVWAALVYIVRGQRLN